MDGHLPLPTLLSWPLVAFILEFDNEFETQAPHRTSSHGSTPGALFAPYLLSMVMWSTFLRHVPKEGICAGDLQDKVGLPTQGFQAWLTRISKWWGYVSVTPARAAARRFEKTATVRPTMGGLRAIEVWGTLESTIERRWRRRFGKEQMNQL